VWAVTSGSRADSANDIAEAQPKRVFKSDRMHPDLDLMYRASPKRRSRQVEPSDAEDGQRPFRSASRILFLNRTASTFDIRPAYHANLTLTA
jgi:hypothetical protein